MVARWLKVVVTVVVVALQRLLWVLVIREKMFEKCFDRKESFNFLQFFYLFLTINFLA